MSIAAPPRILGPNGLPVVPSMVRAARAARAPGRLSASYDAARTTDDNKNHWALADGLSANAAASPGVRRTLRNRSRYEVANNSYARGMVQTIANDCIGTGPRLQLVGEMPPNDAAVVEREFAAWMQATGLAEKLRTMRIAKSEDGEAFALEINNPALATPVKLDVRVIEAEQCTTGTAFLPTARQIDGIDYDDAGNPTRYHLLRDHPGDPLGALGRPEPVDATRVYHWFRVDRPGQRRGIPEITPALPLFAQLRRYTLAVIAAAETAADIAAYLESDANAATEPEEIVPLDNIPIQQRTMLTLPSGWKISQLKAEQPATGYKEFKNEILNEIARGLNVPFNVAAGNSSGYNYSSGQLDHRIYYRSQLVDRAQLGDVMLDRLFLKWRQEAILIEDYLPQSFRTMRTDWSHEWFWDSGELIDPETESKALENLLRTNGTTLADWYAKRGKDWQKQFKQRAREIVEAQALGLAPAPTAAVAPATAAAAAPGTPGAPTPDATAGIQDASLNGAQVTALAAIITAVATKQMPIETARAVILAAFTTINEAEADRMLKPLAAFTPEPKSTAPATRPAAAAPEPEPAAA